MAKKRSSSKRRRKGLYIPDTFGIEYNSPTFLLLLAFVLLVSVLLVSRMFGFY